VHYSEESSEDSIYLSTSWWAYSLILADSSVLFVCF